MKSSEIRQSFIDYFAKKNHHVVESSSLVPTNDPSLLFTNAGMVQFKETFLGLEEPPYRRAVSVQRCVRAGGKHNDLENVGYTARHHTFFEMLGNFSFGDYFKREAIQMAWEFLTTILKLPEARLWVTVYEKDDEAADIWLNEIGVSKERFSRCGEKDNFWSMGETGPCGPCTEIFYDHGESVPGGPPGSEEADKDRYVEIWNLVFMQYNRDKNGVLNPLPKPSVDTGMGLERITAVVQGVHSNYEIDSFQKLIEAILLKVPAVEKDNPSLKVIADHLRAMAFLMVDGVNPSNEGRGYVLRRIIRRAIRHGHKIGLMCPFLHHFIPVLIDVMGDAYPELVDQQKEIEQSLKLEEIQFTKTLDNGLQLLETYLETLPSKVISGEMVFKLYDTYGFPADLTEDIARERGLSVDKDEFKTLMEKQRTQSQAGKAFEQNYTAVESIHEKSVFEGYDLVKVETIVNGILKEAKKVSDLKANEKGALILEKTPFYAESGGQVGDIGIIRSKEAVFEVQDTKRQGSAIIHHGVLKSGTLNLNQTVEAEIDRERRQAIRLNHTATHLLHAALKKILGHHVEQRGSLVDAPRARFDFSYKEALTETQIKALEELVNQEIRANHGAITQIMDLEEAKQSGAVALFGEKYEDKVRVLTIGSFSKELCGGTHVTRTGDIGLFKIIAEYGIASGVRRIEMVTGDYAIKWLHDTIDILKEASDALKTTPSQFISKLNQFIQEHKQLQKEAQNWRQKALAKSSQEYKTAVEQINDVNLLVKEVHDVDTQGLRTLLDELKGSLKKAVVILYKIDSDKVYVITGISKELIGQVPKAATFVQHLCGKGGGRDDLAQGGGDLPHDFTKRLQTLRELLQS